MWVAKAESERSELENTFHEKIPALEGNDKKKKKAAELVSANGKLIHGI